MRVFQRQPGGEFSRETWIVGRGRNQGALGTTSRVEARRLAERFLRELETGDAAPPLPALTLEALWTRYKTEAPAYRLNTERTRAEKEARAKLLIRGLGAKTPVERLALSDVERYAELRRRGTGWADGRTMDPVGPRSVAYDLQVLRTMIRWACTVRQPDGTWLLAENPLRGLSLPKETSPKRPVATHDRFFAVLGVNDDRNCTLSMIEIAHVGGGP